MLSGNCEPCERPTQVLVKESWEYEGLETLNTGKEREAMSFVRGYKTTNMRQ